MRCFLNGGQVSGSGYSRCSRTPVYRLLMLSREECNGGLYGSGGLPAVELSTGACLALEPMWEEMG